jgi:hypothetical protein
MTCSCGCTETIQKPQGQHIGEYCSGCDKWIRWVPRSWQEFVWPIGKTHKSETLKDILIKDRPYLEWAAGNLQGSLQKRAQEALNSTKTPGPIQGDLLEEEPKKQVPIGVECHNSGNTSLQGQIKSIIMLDDKDLPPW